MAFRDAYKCSDMVWDETVGRVSLVMNWYGKRKVEPPTQLLVPGCRVWGPRFKVSKF